MRRIITISAWLDKHSGKCALLGAVASAAVFDAGYTRASIIIFDVHVAFGTWWLLALWLDSESEDRTTQGDDNDE